jgi:hypothetical protein
MTQLKGFRRPELGWLLITFWGLAVIWDIALQAAVQITGLWPSWSDFAYAASVLDAPFLCWA